jgi:hypothetical protein
METIAELLTGCTDQAIISAARRFSAGDVPDQSMTFAPSTPQFVAEVRRAQERIDNNRKLIAPPPGPTRKTLFQRQWERLKAGEIKSMGDGIHAVPERPTLSNKQPNSIWDAVDQKFKPRPPPSDDQFGGLP